jgi:anti-sigma regulatory factor (Ser/Thr protein kinase)
MNASTSLLATMYPSEAPIAERRATLPRGPSAPAQARGIVGQLLRGHQLPELLLENAQLVSSELVSNAYLHGTGEIELRLNLFEDRLRIEVVDDGHGQAPAVRERPADETGGWGLRVVEQLARQWGVFEGTTHVWADLPLS